MFDRMFYLLSICSSLSIAFGQASKPNIIIVVADDLVSVINNVLSSVLDSRNR